MTTKAIFLDFDGTLADFGVVPPAHVRALRAARERGHRVLLCTGRSRAGVPPQVLDIGFDGVVCSAGAYVEIAGSILLDRRFPTDLATRVVDLLDAHDGAYLLEAPDAVYARPQAVERIARRMKERGVEVSKIAPHDIVEFSGSAADVSFAKASCFEASRPVAELAQVLGSSVACVSVSIPGETASGGELYLAEIHKDTGARTAAEALGIDTKDVIAVGDGANDVELLAFAGTAVAIEGGDPRLIELSDVIAGPPSRDGIATLFADLQLI